MKKLLLTVVFYSLVLLASAQIPTDSLIAYWPFSGNAMDQSGNMHHGFVSGATLTADRFGQPNQAYYFNGTSDYIDLSYNPNGMYAPITVSVWVYANSFNDYSCAVGVLANNSTNSGFVLRHNIGLSGSWQVNDVGTTNVSIASNSPAQTGKWIHLLTTIDNSGKNTLYVDGVEQSSTCTYTNMSFNDSFKAGWSGYTTNAYKQYFHGVIDDIRIYSRELNAAEITSLYEENPLSASSFALTERQINVYPNPAEDILYINFEGSESDTQYSLSLINSSAMEIWSANVSRNNTSIDLSRYPSGLYFLQISDKSGAKLKVKKVLVK